MGQLLIPVLTALVAAPLGWLAAWGMLPGLDIASVSSEIAGGIATILSALIAGLLAKFMMAVPK